ncbi:MAG: hypothetical protein IPK18_12245 [Sphingobacteriales bacterium]|jgi:hypothetical protein|nr:MAG: hypothetical protein IPK18_12245 [Sphingobacteriales bacterium]
MSDIKILKDKLHLLIDKIEDEEVLQNYEAFLKNELNPNENWYNDMPESVKKRLQKSIQQAKENNTKEFNTIISKYLV